MKIKNVQGNDFFACHMRMGIGLMSNKRLAVEDIAGCCFQHKKSWYLFHATNSQ